MKFKKGLILLLVAIMGLSLLACGGKKSDTGEDTITMGLSGVEGAFNPIVADKEYDSWHNEIIFEMLIYRNEDGTYKEGPIVESYTLSEDNLTYTFKLKEGVKFSDGKPLTAEDVAFTFKKIAWKEYLGPRAGAVDKLVGYEAYHKGETEEFPGIKVIDEHTISFTYADGNASPANIENFGYGIMPKHIYDVATWEEFIALNTKPVGSGPYVLKEYKHNEYAELERNENYWDPANAAKTKRLMLKNVPQDSISAALKTGEIDFGQLDASVENVNTIEEMNGVSLQSFIGNGFTFMSFNTTRDTLSDAKVRQALMYALNRKEFIKVEYGTELATLGMTPLSPVSWAFPESGLNEYDYDLEKAGQLMDEAGWKKADDGFRYKDGKKFSISWLVYTDSSWPGTLAGLAADSWKELGVDLKVEQMDFVSVSARVTDPAPGEKDFDIYTMGFSLDVDPDPTNGLVDPAAFKAGGFNTSGYSDKDASDLIKRGREEFDVDKRTKIYNEWAIKMNTELPIAIVAYRNEIWGVSDKLSGLKITSYHNWTYSVRTMTRAK